MRQKKLKNAPLKEAIFELYWKLPKDQTNFPTDPELEFALGLFKDAIAPNFPVLKRLSLRGGNKIKIYPSPSYQFWKGELQYPVIQLGPGMITVNDTDKNYSWEGNYQNEIFRAIEILIYSYKGKLNFNTVALKYIDSVDVPDEISFNDFIRRNFRISISTEFALPGEPSGLSINQVFNLQDGSLMKLNIQSAINNNTKKKAIIWITSIEKKANLVKEEIAEWLTMAHNICSDSFEEMLNPDFYAEFNK